MTDKIGKKRIGRIIAVALLAMTLVVGLIPNQALAAETKIADAATITKYMESLGDEASTEYAGRIWTDKTVYADDEAVITLKTGDDLKVKNNSDFLVTYSALATSQAISGSSSSPVDVVFIIDTSGSMEDPMSRTDSTDRIVATVDALNDSIDELMTLNPNNRVAVVAFAQNSEVLLELGRYEKGRYTTGWGPFVQEHEDYFSVSGGNVEVHVYPENSNSMYTDSRNVTGGTNIQGGLHRGMNVLATEDDVTVNIDGKTVQRVPSVVLLSDGAPTRSDTDTNNSSWWNPSHNGSAGDGNTPYYGNGMKALMTGAYMKEAINRNYGVSGTNTETTVYSIGMGITALNQNNGERNLAYMTLNPKDNWNNNNDMANSIRSAWSTYTNGQSPRVQTYSGEYYTLNHPTVNDIYTAEEKDALKNLMDDYYDADSATAVTNVFKTIVSNISISAAEVPTEVKGSDPLSDGFITYTDPIGKYMEVKAIKGIIYDGKFYETKTDGTFPEGADITVDTELYGSHPLTEVEFTKSGTAGVDQSLQIKIPAALIPLRINTVELNADDNHSVKSHTNNGSYPIRVIYEVGLVEQVNEESLYTGTGANKVVNTALLDKEYRDANTDPATGMVNFYSNLFTNTHRVEEEPGHNHSLGDATVEFEPSHSNPFYYIQEDEPIYKKDGSEYVQVPATESINEDDTYYYITEYYHGTSVETEYLERTGAQLKNVELIQKEGYWYRKAGSARVNRVLEFAGHKPNNITSTAEDFYYPTFVSETQNPYDGKFVVYLGNNGKLGVTGEYKPEPVTYPADTQLTGKKVLTGRDLIDADKYSFEITPYSGSAAPTPTPSNVTVEKKDFTVKISDTEHEAPFSFGQITFTEPGTYRYTIVEKELTAEQEQNLPGMTLSRALYRLEVVVEEGTGEKLGTLVIKRAEVQQLYSDKAEELFKYENGQIVLNDNEPDAIVFKNTYSPDDVTRTPVALKDYTDKSGQKPLTSGMFTFKFEPVNYVVNGNIVTAAEDAPMPLDVDNNRLTSVETTNEGGNVTFPSVTFTQSDLKGQNTITYRYKFSEVIPTGADAQGKLNGMTYDKNVYYAELTLSVEGTKNEIVVSVVYKDAQGDPITGSTVPKFNNVYETEPVSLSDENAELHGEKIYNRDITAGLFGFDIVAANDNASAWMSANTGYDTNEEVQVNGTFKFDDMTFTKPGEYKFAITETLPSGANAENNYTVDGTTYDIHTTYATVIIKDENGKLIVDKVTYDNGTVSQVIDEAVFTNSYAVTPVTDTWKLKGTKTLIGKPLVAGEFFFEVYQVGENDQKIGTSYLVPHSTTITKDDKGNDFAEIVFGEEVEFTSPGNYSYIIREQFPTNKVPGTEYDDDEYKYTVVVKDNGEGKLVIDDRKLEERETRDSGAWTLITDSDNNADYNVIDFVNEYAPTPETVKIPPITKVLSGDRKDALKANEFQFKIEILEATPADGITLPKDDQEKTLDTVGNDANGTVQFGDLTISKAGTYTVQISEIIPDGLTQNADGTYTDAESGITYSTQKITTTLEAVDDRYGNLDIRVVNSVGGKTITNEYDTTGTLGSQGEVELAIKKELTGRAWKDDDIFDFEVVIEDSTTLKAVEDGDVIFPADANGIQKVSVAKATPNQTITCPDITFNKPGTYKFLVREVTGKIPGVTYDEKAQEVVVTAEDNGSGELNIKIDDEVKDKILTFKNVYDPASTDLAGHEYLQITKNLDGRQWNSNDVFEFRLEADASDSNTTKAIKDGIVELPANAASLEVTTNNKAHAHFGDIKFHEAGVYKFVISEVKGSLDNMTYDQHKVNVTVTVTDNGNGELVAAPTYVGEMIFNNTYTPDPIQVTLVGTKHLEGRPLKAGEFEFQISKADDTAANVPLPDKTTVKNTVVQTSQGDLEGEVEFNTMTFTEAGTYTYIIREVTPADADKLPGVTYDKGYVEAIVEIGYDDVTGTFSSNVTYYKHEGDGIGFEFVNKYTASATAEVEFIVNKAVDDINAGSNYTLEAGDFQFEIEPSAANPASDPIKTLGGGKQIIKANDANGKVIFDDGVQFTEAGTYVYTVHEVAGNKAGITYDPTIYTITIVVEDDLNGQLIIKSKSVTTPDADLGTDISNIQFNNVYKTTETAAIIHGHKVLEGGHKNLVAGEFQFKLEPVEGKDKDGNPVQVGQIPMPVNDTATNTETGLFQFEMITFTEVGTYKYKVTEVNGGEQGYDYDKANFLVTVEVKDIGGALYANVSGIVDQDGNPVVQFHNDYTPSPAKGQLTGKKQLDGRSIKADEFKFQLLDHYGQEIDVVACGTDGTFAFDLGFDKAGTYTYTINELHTNIPGITYDGNSYSATVVVELNLQTAALEVTEVTYFDENQKVDNVVFNNTYKAAPTAVQLSALKRLEGRALKAGEFSFKIEPVGYYNGEDLVASADIPMPAEGARIVQNNKEGAATFGIMNYDKAGKYEYKVTEEQGTVEHVTYDKTEYRIIVDVKDSEDGYLVASLPNGGDKSTIFTNIYEEPVEPTPNFAKVTFEKLMKIGDGAPTKERQKVAAGDIVTYYMTVRNEAGAGEAQNVIITDEVPAGLILLNEETLDVKNGVITWNIGTLTPGTEITVSFQVKVPAVETDTVWENIALVTYDDPEDPTDPDKEDPSDPVVIEEDVTPALTVNKEASKTDVEPGDEVTYTITVKNTGSGKAENVVVTDEIPAGLKVVGISEVGVNNNGTITWNIGELAAGAEAVVTVTVEIPEVEETTAWTNVATATYNEPGNPDPKEPVPSEPEIIETEVEPVPDVDLTKKQAVNDNEPSGKKQIVKEGDLITYYLTVKNNGTGDATGIVITDMIPEGLELVDAGDGVEEDGTITWEIDKLAAGESKTVYFIVRVPAVTEDATYENTAQLTYNEQSGDPDQQDEPEDSNEVIVEQKAPAPQPKPEEPKNDAPDTGDTSNMMLWLILLGLSGAGLAGAVVYKRKRG